MNKKIHNNMQQESADELYPIVELFLSGSMSFDKLITVINADHRISYKLLKADIEYIGNVNFGSLLLHLKGNEANNAHAISYFDQNNLKHSIHGYA